jgi:5'-nucleotidase
MKKIVIVFAALLMAFNMSAQKLVILHSNDTHSHIDPVRGSDNDGLGGVIERAAYIDSVRAAEGKKNVLLVDAGDFSQGSSYFSIFDGDIEVDVINALGYDVVCLGNHEFDNGLDELARRLKSLKAEVVCANYDFTGLPIAPYVKPYTIVKKAGFKIGIIGVLTDVRPVVDGHIAAKLKYGDAAEVVNKYAEILKNEKKCDLVICLTHIGFDGRDSDVSLAGVSRNVDVIIGGHSHTDLKDIHWEKNSVGENVAIVTDLCWGLYMGKLEVKK